MLNGSSNSTDPRAPGNTSSTSWRRGHSRGEPTRQIPGLNTRLPLFELAMLLVAIALGWAAYHSYNVLGLSKREPDSTQETQEVHEILKLHSLIEVKERYAGFADHLETSVGELRESLLVYLRDKDRSEIAQYRRKAAALEAWIHKQQENLDVRKHQMLRDWLAASTSSNSIALHLEVLLGAGDKALSNYLAAVPLPENKPITPDLVQKKLLKSSAPEMELLSLARQAREQAGAIDEFVERRPGEVAHRARARADREGLTAFIGTVKTDLQPVFYVLVVTLIVQTALLMLGFYERWVVLPMRQRLIEDITAIEHQKKLDHFARLASGLAHEIRNPLTAINVRLFTLQKVLGKGTGEQSDAVLIRNEIDRLEQILKNFLKLARPAEPKFSVMTAEPALREVRDLLGPQLQRQHISLKLAEIPDLRFEADPAQLKQVLINLIQNAADAIGRKGTIVLRARPDEVRIGGRRTRSVVLEVEDSGTGISPEVQERLFDPFFSTKENGTGLGLPIAAKIIDQHRGLLDFDTREGHGTTFRVILPIAA